MTWAMHGMMVIPSDPQLKVIESGNGSFLNFRGTTQGKKNKEGIPEYQYWDCSLYCPLNQVKKWEEDIQPGNVFYVEGAMIESVPILEGKFHKTRVRLDAYKTKKLLTPLWVKE